MKNNQKKIFLILLVLAVLGLTVWAILAFRPNNYKLESTYESAVRDVDYTVANDLSVFFAEKYRVEPREISIALDNNNGVHVMGRVLVGGTMPPDGFFLAAALDGAYRVVHQGSGFVPCATLRGNGFPPEFVAECLNENGALERL